jgi:uncharacterized phage protein (TIGR01671 family)
MMDNREIKFRVWDNNEKRWCHHGKRDGGWEWCNLLCNGEVVCGIDDEVFEPDHKDRHTVELYSGLKDRNGKEIYGGDVIQTFYVTPMGSLTDDPGPRYIVKCQQGMFCINTGFVLKPLCDFIKMVEGEYVCNHGVKMVYDGNCLFKVIGNIHDNPELLEDKQ